MPRILSTEQRELIRGAGGQVPERALSADQRALILSAGGTLPDLPRPEPLPGPAPEPTPGPGEQPRTSPVGSIENTRRGLAHTLEYAGQQIAFEGPTQFFDFLQDTANLIDDSLGTPRGTAFRSIADLSRLPEGQKLTAEGLGEQITGRIARAITGDLPTVTLATRAGGLVKGFAGLKALQAKVAGGDLPTVVAEGIKGALEGGAFKGAEVLTRPAKTAALAVIGGAEPLARGDVPEAAAGAATLGILGLPSAGRVSAREALRDMAEPRPVEAPAGAAEERPPQTGIRDGAAFSIAQPGAEINFRYDVVPLDSLKVNDPETQPRNRSRFAGREQVLNNARDFNTNRFIAGNTELDRGLPIVGADLKVESGNGRIQTLRELRTTSPERFAEFATELRRRASEFGLSPKDFEGIVDPVIVRTRTTSDTDLARIYDIDRRQARKAFADDANARTGLAMSESEQAASDASRLSLRTLNLLDVGATGSIEEALRASRNRHVVGEFLDTFPGNERGTLLNADGAAISNAGIRRLKFAILSRVFPGESGEQLLRAASESTDSNVRNIEAGIFGAVGRLAELKARSAAGQINGDVDIGDDISLAVREVARIRAAGETVGDAMRQTDFTRPTLTPIQEELVRRFALAKSATQVRNLLTSYADVALKLGPPGQMDLGGERPPASKMDVWKAATRPGRAAPEEPESAAYAPRPPRTEKEIDEAIAATRSGEAVSTGPVTSFGGQAADTPDARADIQKRSEIVRWLQQELNLPVRVGHIGLAKRVRGIFKIKPEVVRSRLALDIPTIAHEVGHALDKRFFSGGFEIKKGTFTAFAAELDAIASLPQQGGAKTSEGFAEFMRLYITDAAAAQAAAPRTWTFFESGMKQRAPEVLDTLREARRMWRRWVEQPDEAKILSQMSINEKTDKGIDRRDFYRAALDDLKVLNDFVYDAVGPEKRNWYGKRIPYSNINARDNPYLLAVTNKGWQGIAESYLRRARGAVNLEGDIVGRPLEEILGRVVAADRLDDYRIYSFARRARELHEQGRRTGTQADVAERVFQRLNQDPLMRETFEEQRVWRGHLRQYLLDSEMLTPEGKARMEALHEDYVPFYRVMEDAIADGPPGSRPSFANVFNPIRGLSREGSEREVIDPIESDVKNAYAIINAAERAQVGRAIVHLARQMPGGGKWVEENIPEPIRPIPITAEEFERMLRKYSRRVVSQQVSETLKTASESTSTGGGAPDSRATQLIEGKVREALSARGFAEGEVEQYIKRLRSSKSEGDRTTVIKEITEKIRTVEIKEEIALDLPEQLVDIFRPTGRLPHDEPFVRVWEKGRGKIVRLNPDLYDATLRLDRHVQADLLTKILRPFARALRAGATTLSPEFGPRNFAKDQVMAFMVSRYGYHPGHFLIGLGHVLRDYLPGGDTLVAEYERSGALMASLVSLDREFLQSSVTDVAEGRGALPTVIDAARHPIRTLGLLSMLSEMPTRVANFRLAKRMAERAGVTGREARLRGAIEAREGTTDFGRIGAKTVALNQQIAFANAGLQGLDRVRRAIADDPIGMAIRGLTGITLPSMLLWAANHDDARVEELPQLQRDRHWIFSTGYMPKARWAKMTPAEKVAFNDAHPIFRLPKPYETGLLFGSLIEHALDWMSARRPAEMRRFIFGFLDAMSPGYVPTAVLPLIENYGNWSQWLDRPIVPRGAEDLEPALQKAEYTSETATRIAAAINWVDHGAEVIPEQFRSPAKVENLIRSWTGGAGMLVVSAIDAALATRSGADDPPKPARTWSDVPLIRGFVARYPSSNAEPLAEFYRTFNRVEQLKRTFDARRKEDVVSAKEFLDEHEAELSIRGALGIVNERLDQMRLVQKHFYDSRELSPRAKRAAIDAVTFQMIEQAEQINAIMRKRLQQRRER